MNLTLNRFLSADADAQARYLDEIIDKGNARPPKAKRKLRIVEREILITSAGLRTLLEPVFGNIQVIDASTVAFTAANLKFTATGKPKWLVGECPMMTIRTRLWITIPEELQMDLGRDPHDTCSMVYDIATDKDRVFVDVSHSIYVPACFCAQDIAACGERGVRQILQRIESIKKWAKAGANNE